MRLLVFVVFVICLAPLSLNAQNTRYSTWADPSGTTGGDDSLPAFIEKLNKLIDEAEKAKAADPVFLRDLRNLARGAVTPWNTVLLDDSFTDGNFTANPVWGWNDKRSERQLGGHDSPGHEEFPWMIRSQG